MRPGNGKYKVGVEANIYAPKRTPTQILKDKEDIARWYLRYKTQREIVALIRETRPYTLSLRMINLIIKELVDDWKRSAANDIEAIKARDLQKLNDIEQEATAAYERSRLAARETHEEETTGGDKAKQKKKSVTKKERDGDPRWLEIILQCRRDREKVLGYARPTQVAMIGADGEAVKVETTSTVTIKAESADIEAAMGILANELTSAAGKN